MAQPRRIVPGSTYLVTRRTCQRTFRLRPGTRTNQIVRYCIAWAARKAGVLVLAICVMSNHVHVVVTDPLGTLPAFLRELNRSIAKAMNSLQRQRENFWSSEHASVVLLPTTDDVLDKIGYTVANPVAAGLVKHPAQWPGVVHWNPGSSIVVRRPSVYFDPNGSAPETLELRLEALPESGHDSADWMLRVRKAVADAVKTARNAASERGISFQGVAAVLNKPVMQRAESTEPRRRITPVVASRDVNVRKMFLNIEREFRRAYRTALLAWKAGERLVAFPFGTWWMRVHHRAQVLPAPT